MVLFKIDKEYEPVLKPKPKEESKQECTEVENPSQLKSQSQSQSQPKRHLKYHKYTPEEKRNLIANSASKGQNAEKTSKLEGIGAQNIRRWTSEFNKDPANFGKDMRKQKSGRKIKYPELDEHIKQWFQNLRQARAPVSTFMMRNEARKFINDKNITDINLSKGWQQKIMKRLNVVKRKATHISQKSPLLFEPEIKKFVDLITELRYYVLQSLLIS